MAALARIPFSTQTESVIRQMAGWMLFVAVLHLALGVVLVGAGAVGGVASGTIAANLGDGTPLWIGLLLLVVYGLLGAVMALEGVLLIRARSALRAVVDTDTNDQEHLSTALRRLKMFFLVEVVLGTLALIGSFLQLGFALLVPALRLSGVGS